MAKKPEGAALPRALEFVPLMDSIEGVIRGLKGHTLRERLLLGRLKRKFKIFDVHCCKIAHVIPDSLLPPGVVLSSKASRSKKR